MRSLCEMCMEAEASVTLHGKLKMRVCASCAEAVQERLEAERGMAAERARLFREGKAPKANWGTHRPVPRKRGRPRKQDVPDMEMEMTEGD